jgi:hypothetical protein
VPVERGGSPGIGLRLGFEGGKGAVASRSAKMAAACGKHDFPQAADDEGGDRWRDRGRHPQEGPERAVGRPVGAAADEAECHERRRRQRPGFMGIMGRRPAGGGEIDGLKCRQMADRRLVDPPPARIAWHRRHDRSRKLRRREWGCRGRWQDNVYVGGSNFPGVNTQPQSALGRGCPPLTRHQ